MIIDLGVPYELMVMLVVGLVCGLLFLDIVIFIRKARIQNQETNEATSKLRFFKKHWLLLTNITIVLLVAFLAYDMSTSPGIIWHYPNQSQELDDYQEPVVVVFDRPVNPDHIQGYIHPEVQGEWVLEPVYSWFPWIKRKFAFYPHESIFPQKVFIYYAGITDLFEFTEKWEYGIDAYSVELPKILETVPEHDAYSIPVDQSLEIYLDKPTGKYVDWQIEITPELEYETEISEDGKVIQAKFDSVLDQNSVYKVKIYRIPVRYNIETGEVVERGDPAFLKSLSFRTVKEPLINNVQPSGSDVKADSNITIKFDHNMDQQSVQDSFSIEPEINGQMSWQDESTFIFDPEDLEKDTKYTIKLAKGFKSKGGGIGESQLIHSFTTIGYVEIISTSPGNYSSNLDVNSSIKVTFNQEVDQISAQSKFSIDPDVDGNFSWYGNTLTFVPAQALSYSTGYRVSLASGIKAIYGLDSRSSYNFNFTTEDDIFELQVPVYYQTLRYECNIVATRMALAYRGVYLSTMDVYNTLPKDTTPYNSEANTWGNPNSGYVGDIYGVDKGYGIYWGPIANFINNYRSATPRTGWNRTELLQEVKNGNPSVIWAHNGYSYAGVNISWTTPEGASIYAISGMHSYVVVGYIGNIENPSHVILRDPNRGRYVIPTASFDGLWGVFNNSAVTVY